MNPSIQENIGWLISILIHGILVIIFLLTRFELQAFDLDFTAVNFVAYQQIEKSFNSGGKSSVNRSHPEIDLPKRTEIEDIIPL